MRKGTKFRAGEFRKMGIIYLPSKFIRPEKAPLTRVNSKIL